MYICMCSAVNDATIRKAVADGTTNWKELCKKLKIVQECGKCGLCAKQLFDQTLAEKQRRSTSL